MSVLSHSAISSKAVSGKFSKGSFHGSFLAKSYVAPRIALLLGPHGLFEVNVLYAVSSCSEGTWTSPIRKQKHYFSEKKCIEWLGLHPYCRTRTCKQLQQLVPSPSQQYSEHILSPSPLKLRFPMKKRLWAIRFSENLDQNLLPDKICITVTYSLFNSVWKAS